MNFSLLFGTYVFSFFYISFLNILYFSKNRLDNVENHIYKKLLAVNFYGVVIQIICEITTILQVEPINCIMTKFLLVCFLYMFWKYLSLEISLNLLIIRFFVSLV